MANQVTKKGKQGFGSASIAIPAGTVVPYVVGSFNAGLLDTMSTLADLPAAVWRARGTYLTSKTITDGVFDADDTLVGAVGSPGSATAVGILMVLEAGAPVSSAACLPFHYADVASVLPFLPNGGDVQLNFDSGANRIFAL